MIQESSSHCGIAHEFSKGLFLDDITESVASPGWKYIFLSGDNRSRHRKSIVLLPGGELDNLMWYPLVSQIREEFNFLLIDIPKNIQSKDDIIRGIDRILDEANLPSISLLGYAFGGFIGLYYLVKGKHRLEQLILSHTTFDFGKLGIAEKRLGLFRPMPNWLFKFLLKKKGIITPSHTLWNDWALSYQNHIIAHHIDKTLLFSRFKVLLQLNNVFKELQFSEKKYEVPVFLIDSLDDPTYDTKSKKKHALVKHLASNCSEFVFEKGLGGHHTPICSPQIYATRLKRILDGA